MAHRYYSKPSPISKVSKLKKTEKEEIKQYSCCTVVTEPIYESIGRP